MLSEFDDLVAAMIAAGVPRTKAEACARAQLGVPEAPAARARDDRVLEKTEQAEIVKRLRAAGLVVYNLSQPRATKQAPGLPDLWVFYPGHCGFWFEVKRRVGGVQSPAQVVFQEYCDSAGVRYNIGGVEQAKAIIEELRRCRSSA